MNLDIIVAVLFAIAYFIFIYVTRKTKTFENFSVADRTVGTLLLFGTMSANYIGPGFTLGLTKNGFSGGYFYFFAIGFYGVGKMLEGWFISPKLRAKFPTAYTIGDIVGGVHSHNNKAVQLLSGLISFGLVVGFSVIMSKAGGDILNTFLGIKPIWGTVILTSIVMLYTTFGGIGSTMLTDSVQFTMFIILLPLLAIIAMTNKNFDYNLFYNNVKVLTDNGFKSMPAIEVFSLILTWGFGEILIPPTIASILSSENSQTARKALTYSGAFMFIWLFIMLTLGIISKTVLPNIAANDQVLLKLGSMYYGYGLFGLFTVAMAGVVMSTQDSLINSASVVFTRDIVETIKPLSDKTRFSVARYSCIAVGILSILFATFIPSVIEGLLFFYSVWIPSILVVMLISIYSTKYSSKAAIVSMLSGIFFSIFWNFTDYSKEIPSMLIATFVSAVSYCVVFVSKKV
jgi:solute:Na+ symporter, SSS family